METKDHVREVWRPVKGYEGRYEVSNMGRVRSLQTKRLRHKDGREETVKIRFVMKNRDSRNNNFRSRQRGYTYENYLEVQLYKDGKHRDYYVHKLVAEAFIGPRPAGLVTDHKNGNKRDNRASNLQYITQAENKRKGVCEGNDRSNKYHYTLRIDGLLEFSFESDSIAEIAMQAGINKTRLSWEFHDNGRYERNGITVTRRPKEGANEK